MSGTDKAALDSSFVTLAATSNLANERVLTAGSGVSVTDGGAGGAVTVALASKSFNLFFPITDGYAPTSSPVAFGDGGSANPYIIQQLTTAATTAANCWLVDVGAFLPNGAVITSMIATVQGASGHAGLPTTKPSMQLIQVSSAGTTTTLATGNDASGTTGTYQSQHTISISGSFTLARNTNRYVVRVNGEEGTNALPGLSLLALNISGTYTP